MIESLMTVQPAAGFAWLETAHGPSLVCRALAPWASTYFTTRSWRLGSPASRADGAAWDSVASTVGVPLDRLVRLKQVHGAAVVVVRQNAANGSDANVATGALDEADVVVSDDPSRALTIQTADCVPILLVDPRTGAVGAAHAGWRGLAARVPHVVVRAMSEEFGSRPADLVAAVGPSISAARYEVGQDVRARFASAFAASDVDAWFLSATREHHWLFDGWRSTRDQLVAAGLAPDHIYQANLCTAVHDDLFCSYRRDGEKAGRMIAVIRAARAGSEVKDQGPSTD